MAWFLCYCEYVGTNTTKCKGIPSGPRFIVTPRKQSSRTFSCQAGAQESRGRFTLSHRARLCLCSRKVQQMSRQSHRKHSQTWDQLRTEAHTLETFREGKRPNPWTTSRQLVGSPMEPSNTSSVAAPGLRS